MGVWILNAFTVFVNFSLKFIFFPYKPSHKLNAPLPPGPTSIPILGNFIWFFKLVSKGVQPVLRDLHVKYGPIVTLPIPFTHPTIFIADRTLAHQALVKNGAVFADRAEAQPTIKLISSNQRVVVAAAAYGPTWSLLRRHLISELLHPSRLRSFAGCRKWALELLNNSLATSSAGQPEIQVVDHFRISMTSLLLYMCFGEKVEEGKVREIVDVQRRMLKGLVGEFQMLNFGPTWLTKILFFERWSRFIQIHDQQIDLLLPLIRARKKVKQEGGYSIKNQKQDNYKNYDSFTPYVDTLIDMELPDEKRTFDDEELANQCLEILNSGIDTMSSTLQWMMANIVKHPHMQKKLIAEIKQVMGNEAVEEVKEEVLHKMKYLKAVVLEGLRRHPPGHTLIPHRVTNEVILDGRYAIPKDCEINFMVAEMGWDPMVWAEPMEFKPERFLNDDESVCDITGSKEIKMMPFGAGRRMCPSSGLSILLLEYFVANLVLKFEWSVVDGVGVDLTDKMESIWVMKNPLVAHITPRLKI